MDEGEDSSSPDGPSKGINPQSYRLTPEQFQTAAIEFVANMTEESSIEERAELTRRVISDTKTTKEAPADKPGPKVPEPTISRPDTDSQEKTVKIVDYPQGNSPNPSRSGSLSQGKPLAENPLNPSGYPAEDKTDGEEIQIELEIQGQRKFSNRSKSTQNDNKRGRGTPKTARSKQVVKEKVFELVEVESGKETSHPEKDPTDRLVEGDKQPTLAREPETSKKTLHRDESGQGGHRSDSKNSQASRKKGDKKGKGTGKGMGNVPANNAGGQTPQPGPYPQSGVCPLDYPGVWFCHRLT